MKSINVIKKDWSELDENSCRGLVPETANMPQTCHQGAAAQQHTNLINLKTDRNYKVAHMTAALAMKTMSKYGKSLCWSL